MYFYPISHYRFLSLHFKRYIIKKFKFCQKLYYWWWIWSYLASRQSLLICNNSTWVKILNDNFDVPTGAYDSTQIADLVGIYILDTLSKITDPKQVRLYRDDGLIFIPDSNGPLSSRIQKKIIKALQFLGFKIEISSNLKIDIRYHFQLL